MLWAACTPLATRREGCGGIAALRGTAGGSASDSQTLRAGSWVEGGDEADIYGDPWASLLLRSGDVSKLGVVKFCQFLRE